MQILTRCRKLFNSIGVISVLVVVAMVLTTLTGSAAGEPDPQIRQQSLIQSHLMVPYKPTSRAIQTPLR